ncbi:MAG: sulfatase [Candidatus Hinthialibacter antarcticus]|nr:sulfatase [Candidatus Hinthialibacter antarcticus]
MDRRHFLQSSACGIAASLAGCATSPKRAAQSNGAAKRPNILFCIADDASFPHMGAYGCSWVNTPGFDRVAREGVLFSRAYTPNAKCAPSRACILTGRNSWQLEEAANHIPHFPTKFKTYAETLVEHGYHTGYTAKGWAPGEAVDNNGKKRQLTGKQYSKIKTTPPAKHISDIDYAANFDAFLDDRTGDQPFCFWYGGIEPHRRYEYQAGINKGGKDLSDVDAVPSFWPDNETVRTDMLDYAFEIEYFDQHLQKMLARLEERGELDNTIVIVTADNGMPFPRIKGQEYEMSNHLPLAIMWKGGIQHAGRTIDDIVSFIDFAPTFLELAGVNQRKSEMQPIEGKSLTDILLSSKDGVVNRSRDFVLIGKERHDIGRPHDWGYPIRGLVQGDYLYIRNFEPARWPAGDPETGYLNCDGSPTKTWLIDARMDPKTNPYWASSFSKRPEEELYNITTDPECMNNLASNALLARLKQKMQTKMARELKRQSDPRMFGQGHIFDEYEYAGTDTRGFYDRAMNGEKLKAGWVNPTDFEPDFPR